MAFRVKDKEINHTPDWYYAHCKGEDGGSPSFRKLLDCDMISVDADIDKKAQISERIPSYEGAWNRILEDAGKGGSLPNGMLEAMERDGLAGYGKSQIYGEPPFTLLDKFMKRHGLDEQTIKGYWAWRSRQRKNKERVALKQAEQAIPKPLPSEKWFG